MRLLPLLLLLALPAAMQAQYTYTTHNGTTPITGYSGPGGEVTIPSTLDGLPVILGSMSGTWPSALAANDPFISTQPTNQYRDLGQSGTFSVVAGGTEPLYYQWFKDGLALANGTNVTGVTNSWLTIDRLMATDVGDYTVVVGNQSGSLISVVARMDLNLITVDASFNPGASGGIDCLAFQSDGKVLVGGGFLSLGGQSRTNIGRLNMDGTVDAAFHPGAAGVVICLAVQSDRKIVLGGEFITLGGQSRAYIGRLNVDGTVDSTFNPGASWSVTCLAIQADGKIVVGGFFSSLGGQSRQYLGRLNVDGTVDSTFNPGANDSVACLAIQADGKLIVGGSFSSLGGQTRQFLGRLNVDGSVDNGFNPGANGPVSCLAMQADGKLIIGGNFTSLGGQSLQNLGRLNVDGSVDSTFNSGASGPVSCLGIQTDGKIVVGGNFSSLGGQLRQNLGRLNVNGTVDSTFSPGASDIVYCQAIQADGRIVVAGNFSALGGQSRSFIGRLNNTGPATQQLSFDETTVVWLRGGSSPEFSRVTFDYSTNGASWASLGNGARVPGGWQLTGLSLATNRTIRATGAAVGGGKSDWTVEQVAGAPIIAIQPESIVNNFGSNVSFSVTSYGSPPMQYQWLKDGVTLTNSGNLSGVTTDRLTMTQLSKADEDGYSVLVGNAFGSVTSLVASLTVNDPFITTQPINQLRELGQSGSFSVVAGGTSPVYHRWFKDGVALENGTNTTGVTTSSLTINKLMTTDAGDYWAVVSNQNGSVTSVVATVLLNLCTPDTGFNPVANDLVTSLAIQADGKIIVGGNFTTLGGQSRLRIGRLNVDGTIDSIFNPGANSYVTCLAIQTDEKIVVGGYFSSLGGQSRPYLGRLNADGTVDSGFNPGANNYVNCLAIQPDGKIVVGGYFKVMGGQSRTNIARLNPDGSLDNEFNPGANSYVYCLAIQADGKIVAGGNFTTLNGQASKNIARLNPDGSVDSGFNAAGGGEVDCLAIQADGKIVVGGSFGYLGGQYHPSIGRLNVDGSADNTFRPSARGSTIYCLAIQADGKVIVGGSMNSLCWNIARLNDAEPATQQLSFDGSRVTWLRGGTGPDVWRSTFEFATNGLDWTLIGNGARVSGGWQLSGISIPTNAMIRARGSVINGGVSDWFVETTIGSIDAAMSLNIDRLGEGPVLRVTGGIGLQYLLEYTPVLSATHVWQSMPFTLTNNPQIIIDETMTNANQRYYRLRTN